MTQARRLSIHGTLASVLMLGTLFSVAVPSVAVAEEFVLSSWLPPKHPIVTELVQPWAQAIADATEERVTIRILPKPLGPPPAHFDLAAEGVADITYGLHSFTKDDRFLRSRIGQFSFLGDTAEVTSVAYWNVYGTDLNAQEEHQGTKLLGLFVHGPGMFHNNQRKIETPEDFAGLKIRTPGGYIADLASGLGITTQFMGPGQVFEKLSTGVIDGVTFPIEALAAFKLTDHLTHSMSIPGGMYNTSWFVVMNEDRWNGLSDEDKAAIEALSGEALASMAGRVWDAADSRGTELVAGTSIETYEASDAVVARIRELAGQAEAEWAAAAEKQGYDGAGALATLRAATGQ